MGANVSLKSSHERLVKSMDELEAAKRKAAELLREYELHSKLNCNEFIALLERKKIDFLSYPESIELQRRRGVVLQIRWPIRRSSVGYELVSIKQGLHESLAELPLDTSMENLFKAVHKIWKRI